MTTDTYINSIHIKKMYPIFKKEFKLNFNKEEILILGGNGAGKTSFLRLIQSLRALNFSELFNRSCSYTNQREIDLYYDAYIRNLHLEVFFKESFSSSGEKPLTNKFRNKALSTEVEDNVIISEKYLKAQISEKDFILSFESDDKQCSFFLNDNFIDKIDMLDIKSHNSNPSPTVGEIFIYFWLKIRKKHEASSSMKFVYIYNILMFFDNESRHDPQIFDEDKNYYQLLLTKSELHHTTSKSNDGWFFSRGPWSLEFAPDENGKHWLNERLQESIDRDKSLMTIQATDLPILKIISKDLNVSDIKFNIVLNNKQHTDNETTSVWFLNKITIVDNNGNEFDSDNLSYGQKRYLSLMIYLERNSSYLPYLIDEPTNGLHHGFIENFYYKTEKKSQLFMTTQSSWLLNFIEIDSPDETEKKFIICKKDDGCFTWRNFNKREISSILKSRENGIMRMDEILRTKGIW